MGRSVDYLNRAEYVLYFPFECEDTLEWRDMMDVLTTNIMGRLPSYNDCDSWDDREVHIILENELCEIGISEYMGLVSLSIRTNESVSSYAWDCHDMTGLARNHAHQVRKSLEQAVTEAGMQLLVKMGTFSNGEAVFERKKA